MIAIIINKWHKIQHNQNDILYRSQMLPFTDFNTARNFI